MRFLFLLITVCIAGCINAQHIDTIFANKDTLAVNPGISIHKKGADTDFKPGFKNLVLPVSFISYGMLTRASGELQNWDHNIHDIVSRSKGPHTSADNYIQYAPGLAVYVLNIAGVKGKHNLLNGTILYLLSNAIVGITVEPTKRIFKIARPDGSAHSSFPSGHTATAFAGAEFLRQEYKDISPWYGVAGYVVATSTGFLRMYNNKHWFSDVITGAGFGILATRLAYWLGPLIFKKSFHKKPVSTF